MKHIIIDQDIDIAQDNIDIAQDIDIVDQAHDSFLHLTQ